MLCLDAVPGTRRFCRAGTGLMLLRTLVGVGQMLRPHLYSSGAISNANVYSGFLQKLNDALADRNAGKCSTAANVYSAFINQVMGQIGKGQTASAANILIADAQYLIAHCP